MWLVWLARLHLQKRNVYQPLCMLQLVFDGRCSSQASVHNVATTEGTLEAQLQLGYNRIVRKESDSGWCRGSIQLLDHYKALSVL